MDNSSYNKLSKDSKQKISEFMDRFQGKLTQISKEGHIGVVSTTNKPIEKFILTQHNQINNNIISGSQREQ